MVFASQEDDTNSAPESTILLQPVGKRPRGRPRNHWEDDISKLYTETAIPMTEVNNWTKDRRLIVYPVDADSRRVPTKVKYVK